PSSAGIALHRHLRLSLFAHSYYTNPDMEAPGNTAQTLRRYELHTSSSSLANTSRLATVDGRRLRSAPKCGRGHEKFGLLSGESAKDLHIRGHCACPLQVQDSN